MNILSTNVGFYPFFTQYLIEFSSVIKIKLIIIFIVHDYVNACVRAYTVKKRIMVLNASCLSNVGWLEELWITECAVVSFLYILK